MLGISTTNARVGGFRGGILADSKTIYNRIIADGGVSNLTRLNFFVKGLKAIYGDLANVPVCYDAHWIGYKLGSGTGATAGQAAAKLYSLTVAADAVQTTAASQPLLLSHNGASSDNYWYNAGVSGNYVATASQSALKFNTDFSVVVNLESYLAATTMELAGSSGGWAAFSIGFTGLLAFDFGGVRFTSTLAISGTTNWIRYSASGTSLFFYTSTDGATWTQLGTTVTMSARATPTNIEIFAGRGNANIAAPLNGKIKSIKYYTDSALATLVYNFNPSTYNAATSQTAWTSATGEVWTINTGTATTGYKGVLVDRTIVQGDGVDDSLKNTPFATSANCTDYIAFEQFGWVNADFIFDGAVIDSIGLQQTTISPNIRFEGAGGGAGVGNFIVNTLSMATILGTLTPGSVNLFRNNTSLLIGGTKADSQGYTLFAKANSTSYGNASINTMIKALGQDDATTRTATYNLIRSLNNNAF